MSSMVISCILTGIISVAISYFINIHLGNRREKNKIIYNQLKNYADNLASLIEQWSEFNELMDNWNLEIKDNNKKIAPIFLKNSMFKIINIENEFTSYRESVHDTKEIIANNFNDDNVFTMSVYSMNADKGDEYSEANFLEFFKKDYQLRTNGENSLLDEDVALAIMNRMYGTYIQIYKYRIQVKMEKAQDYIDQKLQLVSNSISKHKL